MLLKKYILCGLFAAGLTAFTGCDDLFRDTRRQDVGKRHLEEPHAFGRVCLAMVSEHELRLLYLRSHDHRFGQKRFALLHALVRRSDSALQERLLQCRLR